MNYKAALNVAMRDVGDAAVWGLEGATETGTALASSRGTTPSRVSLPQPELPGARGSRSTAQSPEPSEEAAAAGKERCELFTRAAEGRIQYPASNGRADRRGFVMSGRLDP